MTWSGEVGWLVRSASPGLLLDGAAVPGSVWRFHGGRFLVVALAGESGSYWVALPQGKPAEKEGSADWCEWRPPAFPLVLLHSADPPCMASREGGGDVRNSRDRKLSVDSAGVAFVTDDGRRLRFRR